MSKELERLQKRLNSKDLCPRKGFRRDVKIYELVCYVNNITGCYLSDNIEPIKVFINRARTYMNDNAFDKVNMPYFDVVGEYLNLVENYLHEKK